MPGLRNAATARMEAVKPKSPCLDCGHSNHAAFVCYELEHYGPRLAVECFCRRYRKKPRAKSG